MNDSGAVINDDGVDTSARSTAKPAFALTSGRTKGYHRAAVDTFLASARQAFEGGGDDLTAEDVRTASFPLVKEGYAVAEVDAALGRVEDAFAARERERAGRGGGVPPRWPPRPTRPFSRRRRTTRRHRSRSSPFSSDHGPPHRCAPTPNDGASTSSSSPRKSVTA